MHSFWCTNSRRIVFILPQPVWWTAECRLPLFCDTSTFVCSLMLVLSHSSVDMALHRWLWKKSLKIYLISEIFREIFGNFLIYISKISEIFLKIFKDFTWNFLKGFLKFSDIILKNFDNISGYVQNVSQKFW